MGGGQNQFDIAMTDTDPNRAPGPPTGRQGTGGLDLTEMQGLFQMLEPPGQQLPTPPVMQRPPGTPTPTPQALPLMKALMARGLLG